MPYRTTWRSPRSLLHLSVLLARPALGLRVSRGNGGPKPGEIEDGIREQEVLAAKWRALPGLREDSALLAAAQEGPYFRRWSAGPATAGELEERAEASEGNLLIVTHHKAGENLASRLVRALQSERENYARGAWSRPGEHVFSLYAPGGWHNPVDVPVSATGSKIPVVLEPSTDWALPRNARVVHFVRDPVDMILSGYRYHRNRFGEELWSWGRYPNLCFMCDEADHDAIFSLCGGNCTYAELLNRVGESTGVVLEAVHARRVAWSVLGNLRRWGENPNVFHVSFDLLSRDYDKTVRCMLNFLGRQNETLVQRVSKILQSPTRKNHVTHGMYDNTALEKLLREHSAWGRGFREAAEALSAVFARQSRLYGCPGMEG